MGGVVKDETETHLEEIELRGQLNKLVDGLKSDISTFDEAVGSLPDKLDQNVTNFLDYEEKAIDNLNKFGMASEKFRNGILMHILIVVASFIAAPILFWYFLDRDIYWWVPVATGVFIAGYFIYFIRRLNGQYNYTENTESVRADLKKFREMGQENRAVKGDDHTYTIFKRLFKQTAILKNILGKAIQFSDTGQKYVRYIKYLHELRLFRSKVYGVLSEFHDVLSPELIEYIDIFAPSTTSLPDIWIKEFSINGKKILGDLGDFLDVFYYSFSSTSDEGKIRWSRLMKADAEKKITPLEKLAAFLVDHGTLWQRSNDLARGTLLTIVTLVCASLEQYSNILYREVLANTMSKIEDTRRRLSVASRLFNIVETANYMEKWVPKSLDRFEEDIILSFAEKFGLDLDYLYIVSDTIIDSEKARSRFTSIKQRGELGGFCQFLKDRRVISTSLSPEYMSTLLEGFSYFNLNNYSDLVNSFQLSITAFEGIKERLFEKMKLFNSLSSYKLTTKRIDGISSGFNDFDILKSLMTDAILSINGEEGIIQLKSGGIDETAVAMILASTYFEITGHVRRHEIWKKVFEDDLLSRIFYRLIVVTDTQNSYLNPEMLEIALRTFKLTDECEFLSDFKTALSYGLFVQRESLLLGRNLDDIKKTLEDKATRSDIEKVVEMIGPRVKQLLNLKIKPRYINLLLLSNKITAYLLSIPPGSHESIIGGPLGTPEDKSNDPTFYGVCKCLYNSEKKKEFKNFLVLRKGAGRYIRIGLAPYDQDFDTFKANFETLLKIVYRKRNTGTGSSLVWKVGLYRVFPAREYMASMKMDSSLSSTLEDTELQENIKEMINDTFPSQLKFSIVASMEGGVSDSNSAIVAAITECMEDATLVGLGSNELIKNPLYLKAFTDEVTQKSLDTKLFEMFGVESKRVADLAKEIHLNYKRKNKNSTIDLILKAVNQVAKSKDGVQDVDVNAFADKVLEVCNLVGSALLT